MAGEPQYVLFLCCCFLCVCLRSVLHFLCLGFIMCVVLCSHRRSISVEASAHTHGSPLTGEEHLPVALLCVPESTSSWDVSMAQRSRRPSMAPGGSRRPSMASNPGSGVLGPGSLGGVLTIPPDMPKQPTSPPSSGSPQLQTHSLSQTSQHARQSSFDRQGSGNFDRPSGLDRQGSGAQNSPASSSRFTFAVGGSGQQQPSPVKS